MEIMKIRAKNPLCLFPLFLYRTNRFWVIKGTPKVKIAASNFVVEFIKVSNPISEVARK
jgi:hypothetical protein